jgi:hypothetical protein
LAQTVGGVRQYNNLLALMNNYSDFKLNVEVSEDSKRTLQVQSDIYAKSWEAASNRVRSELEGLWDSLINDEFMIELMDWFKDLIHNVKIAVRGFGGLRGIFQTVGAVLLKIKKTEITKFFNDAGKAVVHMLPGVKSMEEHANRMFKREAEKQSLLASGLSISKD